MLQPIEIFDILLLFAAVILVSWFLSAYVAQIFSNAPSKKLDRILNPIENAIYKVTGVDTGHSMGWKEYFFAALYVNIVQMAIAFVILTGAGLLPLNPMHFPGLSWDLAFNTAVSIATNTNLQHYAGEQRLSILSQMTAIQFLQFTSAATGVCVAVAMVRGFIARSTNLGNFYVDFVRSLTRLLIPLCFIAALIMIGLGVPQTLSAGTVSDNRAGSFSDDSDRTRRIACLDNANRHQWRRVLRSEFCLPIPESQRYQRCGADILDAAFTHYSHLCFRANDWEEAREQADNRWCIHSVCYRLGHSLHPQSSRTSGKAWRQGLEALCRHSGPW